MKQLLKSAVVGACLGTLCLVTTSSASAQCSTCPTPVVAFQPVVQPTTVTYTPVTGWYPGKMLDNWRMRRWGFSAPVAVTSVAPTTVGFAPTTVGFAPTTVGFAPTTVGFAPTSTFVPQTVGFAPVTTVGFAPMATSVNHVTAFAPLGQRQVLMRPVVVESPVISSSSLTSASITPCSTCSSCEPCSHCASGSSITYAGPSTTSPMPSSQMSAPSLTPQEAAPLRSEYAPASREQDVTPPAKSDVNPPNDPGPAGSGSRSSTYFEAPKLFNPQDRTAQDEATKPINRAPSVDVWTAVYSKPVTTDNISTTTTQRSQAEIDADGWHSVPAGR